MYAKNKYVIKYKTSLTTDIKCVCVCWLLIIKIVGDFICKLCGVYDDDDKNIVVIAKPAAC